MFLCIFPAMVLKSDFSSLSNVTCAYIFIIQKNNYFRKVVSQKGKFLSEPFLYNAQFLKECGTNRDGHSAITDIVNNYKLFILFKMHFTINHEGLLQILCISHIIHQEIFMIPFEPCIFFVSMVVPVLSSSGWMYTYVSDR
jgi:hypothetical protein